MSDYRQVDCGYGMTAHVLGEAEETVWCPECRLPSASVYTVTFTLFGGAVFNDTQRRFVCHDCGSEAIVP